MRERLPHVPVRARARAWRRCVRTFWLAPWAVRRARVAPVLHRRLWIDAGCVAYGGGCSIDFARAPASRGGCWPAIARGTALRDGEEARPRLGAPPMHCRSAPLQAAVVRQFTPCNARARGVLRAWARPRGSAQGACQAARPSEQSGGLQAALSRRSTSGTAPRKRRRAAGGTARTSRRVRARGKKRTLRRCCKRGLIYTHSPNSREAHSPAQVPSSERTPTEQKSEWNTTGAYGGGGGWSDHPPPPP